MNIRTIAFFSALFVSVPMSAFAEGESAADFRDDQFHEQIGPMPGTVVIPSTDLPFISPPPLTGQDQYVPPAAVDGWVPPATPLESN